MDSYKRNVFLSLDKDRSGFIDETELYTYFCTEFGSQFDHTAIKLVVGMFKQPGTLGLNCDQFVRCYDNIDSWKHVFVKLDKDRSGSIGLNELDNAFKGYGMYFTQPTLQRLLHKYDSSRRGALTFVDFFRAMVTIKLLSTRYSELRGNSYNPDFRTRYHTTLDDILNYATNNAELIAPSLIPKKYY